MGYPSHLYPTMDPSIPLDCLLTFLQSLGLHISPVALIKHHNARQLRPLQTGEQVYIPDNSSNGTVIDEPSPRSYNVQTSGGIYRRNRRHLLPLPTESVTPEDNVTPENLPPNTCRTKSGRISRPPERLCKGNVV